MWRLKRVRQHDDQLLQAHIDRVQAYNDQVPLRAALQAMAPEFALADTVKKVEVLLKKHKSYANVIVHWVPRPTDAGNEAPWGAAISEHLKNLKVGEVVEGPSEITTFVDPFKVELQEDRMGRLDDRILTVTKRLVQVKASKELLGSRKVPPKMVSVASRREPESHDQQRTGHHRRRRSQGHLRENNVGAKPDRLQVWESAPVETSRGPRILGRNLYDGWQNCEEVIGISGIEVFESARLSCKTCRIRRQVRSKNLT